jgi:hypothetical protein
MAQDRTSNLTVPWMKTIGGESLLSSPQRNHSIDGSPVLSGGVTPRCSGGDSRAELRDARSSAAIARGRWAGGVTARWEQERIQSVSRTEEVLGVKRLKEVLRFPASGSWLFLVLKKTTRTTKDIWTPLGTYCSVGACAPIPQMVMVVPIWNMPLA